MIRRVLAALVLLVVAAILLVAVWPQLFGLQAAPVIAQVVALRGIDIAIALGAAILVGIVAAAWKRSRRFLGSIVALLLVFCLASFVILGSRGFESTTTSKSTASNVTVLSWNTKGDAPGAPAIAKLAIDEHADIVALPETTLVTGKVVAQLMKASGRPMWVYSLAYDYVSKSRSTTLLISASLGRYSATNLSRTTAVLPTVIARPDSGTGPTIIAVHAVSPIPREMRNWRNDLRSLADLCSGGNTIMAGDFNSTLDALNAHSSRSGSNFGKCNDAASARHGAANGTWPTMLPMVLGAQIDHIMSTSDWKTLSMKVVGTEDHSGSDHRPIVATLAPVS